MNSDTKRFIETLTCGANEVHLQSFSEGKNQRRPDQIFGHINDLDPWINEKVSSGQGVFCAVNETDGLGRKKSNITRVRALVADFDDATIDNLNLIEQLTPKPHIVVNTSPGKYHAYWLVSNCETQQFKPIQQAIIRRLGTDPSVCDLSRVLRLPGSFHFKHDPYLVRTINIRGNTPMPPPYTVEMIIEGLKLELQTKETPNLNEPVFSDHHQMKSDEKVLKEIEEARYQTNTDKPSVYDLFNANTSKLSAYYPDCAEKNVYNASSADLALCYHLAQLANGNFKQIDRLFRRSKLYREKWNRDDYREKTIKKAIEGSTKGIPTPQQNSSYTSSGEVSSLREFEIRSGTAGNGDHVQNAIHLLENIFNGRLKKYESNFLWWNGKYYEIADHSTVRNKVGLAISGAGKATQSNIKSQTDTLFDHAEEIADIDPPTSKVFFKNGVFDLSKKSFEPHCSSNNNTRILNASYNTSAKASEYARWQEDIFSSHPEQVEFLEEILGFLLFRGNLGIEKAILFIGPPRAGKGTLAWLIKEILGPAATAFKLCDLHDGKQINTLRHAQVGIDSEATGPTYRHIRETVTRFKAITANDYLSSPVLYQAKTWNGPTNCKLVAMANSVPYLPDDSNAASNRWIIVVFSKSFQGSEDTTLRSRLTREIDGIAMLALRGAIRLMERGKFQMPSVGVDMLANLLSTSGGIRDFVSSQCTLDDSHKCAEKDLYMRYTQWCNDEYQKPLGRQFFLKALEDATRGDGVLRKQSVRVPGLINPTRGFTGIALTSPPNRVSLAPLPYKAPKPPPLPQPRIPTQH